MRTWAKSTLITASFVAFGVTALPASAAFAGTTNGDSSVLGGNQANVPVTAPVNVCGNSVAVIGAAKADCKGGSSAHKGGHKPGKHKPGKHKPGKHKPGKHKGRQVTSGKHGIGAGNQVNVPVKAPVNACGNAVAVAGKAGASCKGGAAVRTGGHGKGGGKGGGQYTSGKHSILGGNQVNVPITVPVNVCGNAVAVIGAAKAGCKGEAEVKRQAASGARGAGATASSARLGRGTPGPGDLGTAPKLPKLPGLSTGGVKTLPKLPKAGQRRTRSGGPGADVLSGSAVTRGVKVPEAAQLGALKPVAAVESTATEPRTSSVWGIGMAAMFVSGAFALTRKVRPGRR